MIRVYVTVRDDGYINGWYSSKPGMQTQLIEADESLAGNLDCVYVKNGKAVKDEKKYQKIKEEYVE